MARSWLQLVACAAAAVAGVRCQAPEPARPRAETVAIVDVAVLPMTSERVLRDHTVIVAGGVITRIGPRASVVIPPHAQRIDGRGRYLIPGLIDTHVHLRDVSELRSYLAYGVTSVIHQSGPVGNVPDVLRLGAQVLAGEVTGPTVYATGRMLDGNPPIYPNTSVAIRTVEEAQSAVARQVEAGADFIKVYNNLPGAALRAAVAAAHSCLAPTPRRLDCFRERQRISSFASSSRPASRHIRRWPPERAARGDFCRSTRAATGSAPLRRAAAPT